MPKAYEFGKASISSVYKTNMSKCTHFHIFFLSDIKFYLTNPKEQSVGDIDKRPIDSAH